ncbi:Uma2 family endonuclease [methane-oxidizing endosymbiont of Gigantopelta aegis]|uniref:Uma2 family endonuclease n=1 Tax=methane-oxidizing endosymbiont of Gigantopelta aegis TaxID=2794938 RepID=UPI001FD9F6BB|nr:Uma2 family endonuclease [methane-oxidizing endosymbiont of Gigantopelta aegis]
MVTYVKWQQPLMVDCHFDESQPFYTDSSIIIVEVLSKATRKIDETIKLLSYINLPSLQEYVLIEQDYVDVQVLRQSETWFPRHYFLGDDVTFESIDLALPVEEIYARVHNEDMIEFLKYKTAQ